MYQVTKEHIKNGESCSIWHCPLAISISDSLGWDATVNKTEVYRYESLSKAGPDYFYYLSPQIQDWIQQFDKEIESEPFEFEIEDNFIKMKNEVLTEVI